MVAELREIRAKVPKIIYASIILFILNTLFFACVHAREIDKLFRSSKKDIPVSAGNSFRKTKFLQETQHLDLAVSQPMFSAPPADPPPPVDPGIEQLIKDLGHQNSEIQQKAKERLVNIGQPAVDPLIQALNHDNPHVRTGVTVALGEIGSLPNIDPALRINIADSLAKTLLKENNFFVMREILLALKKIAEPQSVDLLIQTLEGGKDVTLQMQKYAAEALGILSTSAGFDQVTKDKIVDSLIKTLESPDAGPKGNVAVALGLTGDPKAVGALAKLLNDGDKDIRYAAAKGLILLGDMAIEPLKAALGNNDPVLRQMAEGALVNIMGNEAVKSYLQEIRNSETDPVKLSYLNQMLSNVEEALRCIDGIESTYGIAVDGKFNLAQLQGISEVLNAYPKELLSGLKAINFIPKEGAEGGASGYYGDQTIGLAGNDPSDLTLLFHEIAHHIDYSRYNAIAFLELYQNSKSDDDFAPCDYAKTNYGEDFAVTLAYYGLDTQKQFLRAIDSAQAGKPVYLEKLLFALDVFTNGHPESTIMFKVDGDTLRQVQVNVGRDDSGKITDIGGISISDLDKLKVFFKNLQF